MPEADSSLSLPVGVIVTVLPAVLWAAAVVFAAIAVWRAPKPITFGLIADKLLRYLFVFPLGVQGLWGFFGHVFLTEDAAGALGWAQSPFQYEVGVASLGLGLASLYAAFSGFAARAAVAIVASCFLAGAGFGHVMDILAGDTLSPGKAAPILITDFVTPIMVLVLLILTPRGAAPAVKAKDTVAGRIEEALKQVQEEPQPAPRAPRLEDELEQARQAMRGAFTSAPKPEALPPAQGAERSGAGPRRKGHRDRANT